MAHSFEELLGEGESPEDSVEKVPGEESPSKIRAIKPHPINQLVRSHSL